MTTEEDTENQSHQDLPPAADDSHLGEHVDTITELPSLANMDETQIIDFDEPPTGTD